MKCFCSEKGCITPLCLYNNTLGDVTLAIEESLLSEESLTICAGCENPTDHSQHNVVKITPNQLLSLYNGPKHITFTP